MFVIQMAAADSGASAGVLLLGVACELGHQSGPMPGLRDRVIQLFDELRSPVFQHLLYMGLSPEEADEVVQETFLRLYEHMLANRDDGNLRGWVFRVAHNFSQDRRRGRKYLCAIDEQQWRAASESRVDSALSPEEALLRKEKMARLRSQIATLSPQQQQCLHLRVEGLRYREIAEILGISISTVAEMLRRAIGRLSREFDAGKQHE